MQSEFFEEVTQFPEEKIEISLGQAPKDTEPQ